MSPAPSAAELMRRLDELVSEFRSLRADLDASFLRTRVYDADRATDQYQAKSIEDGLHQLGKRVDAWEKRATAAATARWSWIATSLLGPVMVVVMLRALGLVHG